jgi:hypothetical protein
MAKCLKSVLALLLAVLVLGASSQAAVCEIACEMAACPVPAADAPMPEMAHGHCGSATMHPPTHEDRGTSFRGLHATACEHSSSFAIENTAASQVRFAKAPWALRTAALLDLPIPARMAMAKRRPPPLRAATGPALISLRL